MGANLSQIWDIAEGGAWIVSPRWRGRRCRPCIGDVGRASRDEARRMASMLGSVPWLLVLVRGKNLIIAGVILTYFLDGRSQDTMYPIVV